MMTVVREGREKAEGLRYRGAAGTYRYATSCGDMPTAGVSTEEMPNQDGRIVPKGKMHSVSLKQSKTGRHRNSESNRGRTHPVWTVREKMAAAAEGLLN